MNYYEILGITKDSTEHEIRKAYRKIAIIKHPDKNPEDKNSTINFQKITEAYSVLIDSKKRALYDIKINSFSRIKYRDPLREKKEVKITATYQINVSLINLIVFKSITFKIDYYPYPLKISLVGVEDKTIKNITIIQDGEIKRFQFVFYFINENGFKIDGSNLILDQNISIWNILFGSKVKIKLLDGSIYVNLPKKIHNLKYLKIKGRGLYISDIARGDLILGLKISKFSKKVLKFLGK